MFHLFRRRVEWSTRKYFGHKTLTAKKEKSCRSSIVFGTLTEVIIVQNQGRTSFVTAQGETEMNSTDLCRKIVQMRLDELNLTTCITPSSPNNCNSRCSRWGRRNEGESDRKSQADAIMPKPEFFEAWKKGHMREVIPWYSHRRRSLSQKSLNKIFDGTSWKRSWDGYWLIGARRLPLVDQWPRTIGRPDRNSAAFSLIHRLINSVSDMMVIRWWVSLLSLASMSRGEPEEEVVFAG